MDKENVPSTPKGEKSAHSSPLRPLNPVSPNKVANSYVGKLSFLQNDNIDAHFSHLHSTQEDVQLTLHKLEVQTAQTALDLGQLVDRLKNNNLYLNKLLEGLSSREEEHHGIGRGDLDEILNKIEHFQSAKDDNKSKLDEILAKIERQASGNGSTDKIQGLVAEILEAFQRSSSTVTNAVDVSTSKLSAQVGRVLEDVVGISTSFKIEQDRMTTEQLKQISLISSSLDEQLSEQQKQTNLIASLSKQLSEQQAVIQSLILKEQNAQQLEAKLNSLQGKYEQLCDAYQGKFNDLKSLKEEYSELQRMTESLQEESQLQLGQLPKRISKANKFNQLNQLHSSNLSHIQSFGNGLPMPYAEKRVSQKRIASTPNKLFVDDSGSASTNMSD